MVKIAPPPHPIDEYLIREVIVGVGTAFVSQILQFEDALALDLKKIEFICEIDFHSKIDKCWEG